MDSYVISVLESWQLDLVDRFKEQGIDETAFKELTPKIIKELIPQIGLRIKFLKKWNERFKNMSSVVQHTLPTDSTRDTDSASESNGNSDNTSDSEDKENKIKRQKCFVGQRMYEAMTRPHVKQLLQRSAEGRAILKTYTRDKRLSRKCRNIIVDIIISHIINSLRGGLKHEDFAIISSQIVEVFPTENKKTYYISPTKKKFSTSNKSITSRGKLVDKYRNKIRRFKKLCGENIIDEACSSTSAGGNYETQSEDDLESAKENALWLQKNQSPWELVITKWKDTFAFRQNKIKKNRGGSVSEILIDWPILRHPLGCTLLSSDFYYLQLTKENDPIANWENFFNVIRNLCPLSKSDKAAVELSDMLVQNTGTDDSKTAIQLSLLSHLIPPKGRIRTEGRQWKPSIAECKESIILHAKIPGDISRLQEAKYENMKRKGLPLQPYIIIIGPNIQEIGSSFVCVDAILYATPSVISAVDACFKAFHALDAAYPAESEHIWQVIQLGLYKFNTAYDKQISYIMHIVNAFR